MRFFIAAAYLTPKYYIGEADKVFVTGLVYYVFLYFNSPLGLFSFSTVLIIQNPANYFCKMQKNTAKQVTLYAKSRMRS